jgi:hypothetical protein
MLFHARKKHAVISASIEQNHPSLYRDDALVTRLRQSYAAAPVIPPFDNLESSSSMGQNGRAIRGPGVLAIVPWLPAGGAEAVLHAVLSGLKAQPSVGITIVTCEPSRNEWHARFAALTDQIYHLPAFLPPEVWTAFVHYLVRTREVASVLVSGTQFGYSILPTLKPLTPAHRRCSTNRPGAVRRADTNVQNPRYPQRRRHRALRTDAVPPSRCTTRMGP